MFLYENTIILQTNRDLARIGISAMHSCLKKTSKSDVWLDGSHCIQKNVNTIISARFKALKVYLMGAFCISVSKILLDFVFIFEIDNNVIYL